MSHLVATNGPLLGRTWLITEAGLRCGRGADCDVPIDDPTVSRHHCLIRQTEDGFNVAALAENNATLVNSVLVRESPLRLSDIIGIGNATFTVASTAMVPPIDRLFSTDNKTPSLSDWDGILFSLDSKDGPRIHFPQTVRDMAELFALGRILASLHSLKELFAQFASKMTFLFDPEWLWITRYDPVSELLDYVTVEVSFAGTPDPAVLDTMERAVRGQEAMLLNGRAKRGSRTASPSTYVAPISLEGEKIGAVAIREKRGHSTDEQRKLMYLTAAAQQLAPLIPLFERWEDLQRDVERLKSATCPAHALVGTSASMRGVRRLIRDGARSNLNVLITGETGTGKELAAQMIHDHSSRSGGPFVVLNCAAIPKELFESELFGHEQGAFTGAAARKIGRLERAHGGTFFLDEIGDLSLEHQARILRVIEQGTFHRIGNDEEMQVDVRIVAATNKNLQAAMEQKTFRADVYHRLNEIPIELPALRQRRADIPLLIEHFFQIARDQNPRSLSGISPQAIEYLRSQPWPGNVRELRACIFRGVVLAQGEEIGIKDVSLSAAHSSTEGEARASLPEVEKRHISLVLQACGGNTKLAAKTLGIARSTLYKKVALYGIDH